MAQSMARLGSEMLRCATFAGAALLLTGCGGMGQPAQGVAPQGPEQCGCSDLYVFSSRADKLGEPLLLSFTDETCCGGLASFAEAGWSGSLVSIMGALASGGAPHVPPALLEAARPLCRARCPAALSGCKTSATGRPEACENSQFQGYQRAFEYVCSKADPTEGGEPSAPKEKAEQCGCSDLYALPSRFETSGTPVLLSFTDEKCCKDLASLVDDGLSDALVSVMWALAQGDVPHVSPALLEAARPLCRARCPAALSGCKSSAGGRPEECAASQLQDYRRVLEHVCSKVHPPHIGAGAAFLALDVPGAAHEPSTAGRGQSTRTRHARAGR